MFHIQSQWYSKCFCHIDIQGVSVAVVLKMFQSQFIQNVSVTVVFSMFQSQWCSKCFKVYSKCFSHSGIENVLVTGVQNVPGTLYS